MSSMTVNVLVTNWESMDNSRRSLVNFLMKNGKVHLHGIYEEPYNSYRGFTGCITHKYTAFQHISYGVDECMDYPICYTLNLPIANVAVNTYPVDVDKDTWLPLISSQLTQSASEISFVKYEYLPLQQHSGSGSDSQAQIDQNESYKAYKVCDITGDDVIITPMVGGVPNTDTSVRPSNLLNASKHAISVNMTNATPVIDYQLRTATFRAMAAGINHGSNGSMSFPDSYGYDYYYKIGIVPFTSDISSVDLTSSGTTDSLDNRLNSIISYLKSCTFDIKFISDFLTIGFTDDNDTGMKLSISTSLGQAGNTAPDSNSTEILPDNIIIPITSYRSDYNTANYSEIYDDYIDIEEYNIKGIAYLQLCSGANNSDQCLNGAPLAISSDGESWSRVTSNSACKLAITDQGMSGEFIPYNLENTQE